MPPLTIQFLNSLQQSPTELMFFYYILDDDAQVQQQEQQFTPHIASGLLAVIGFLAQSC